MTEPQQPTKADRKAAARAEREAAQAAEAARAARKRRLMILGGALAAAIAVVVIIAIVAGGGSSDNTPKKQAGETVAGQNNMHQILDGIPQSGAVLGNPKAKYTLLEFADLQCPVCRDYSVNYFPRIVQDYVRPGKIKVQFVNLSFIGPDSVKAGRFAYGASRQNKLWNFADLFYANQGQENTGYVTDDFLKKIGEGAGVDVATARAAAAGAGGQNWLATANTTARIKGVDSTPTFALGPDAKSAQKLPASYTQLQAELAKRLKTGA